VLLVFSYPPLQVVRNACVERPRTARHDVNVVGTHTARVYHSRRTSQENH
jgi:hypothetical protein